VAGRAGWQLVVVDGVGGAESSGKGG